MSDIQVPPSFRQGKGNKLNSYELAKYLMEAYHVINLHDMLYIYGDGIYEHKMKRIESLILELAGGAKPAEVKAVIRDLSTIAPAREETSYRYVAFNNCIVDIQSLHTFDFSPDEFVITSKVYANYDIGLLENPTPDVEFVKAFFDVISCGDSELKTLLFEIIVYSMIRTAKYQLAFILKGTANNGKSDFLHIIEALLRQYCSHQNLSQLSDAKNLMSIYGCTANIVDDVKEPKKIDLAVIQSIISGGTLAVEWNKDQEFAFAPYCTLFLATNYYDFFKGYNKGLSRRFMIIPFNANLDGCSDVDMTENICSSAKLDVIATLALQVFRNVIIDKHFHIPEQVENLTRAFFFENNPIMEFATLYPIKRLISKQDYYTKYYTWCSDNAREADTPAVFGKKFLAVSGCVSKSHSVDGVFDTFYEAPDFSMTKLRLDYDKYLNSLEDRSTGMKLMQYVKYLDKQDIK